MSNQQLTFINIDRLVRLISSKHKDKPYLVWVTMSSGSQHITVYPARCTHKQRPILKTRTHGTLWGVGRGSAIRERHAWERVCNRDR